MKRFANLLRGLLLAAALAGTALAAHAGRTCEARLPRADSVQRAMQLAQATARRLDDSGAQVVVLARAGQDLSRYGLRWSHLGLAYREPGAWRDGEQGLPVWRVVHKLNQCGSAQAGLHRQGLGEFFLDDLFEYQAAFVVLRPDVQQRLRPLLADNTQVARVHTPAYSMVAYPWALQYQQSNQWALETLALAYEPAISQRTAPHAHDDATALRRRAQAWLQLQGYEPTTLRISALTRLGARMTAAHIAFDDHPNDKRFSDHIETVTVDSVFDWLQRSGLGAEVKVLR